MPQLILIIKIFVIAAAALAFCLLPHFSALALWRQKKKQDKNIIRIYKTSVLAVCIILFIINLFFQIKLDRTAADLVFVLIAFAEAALCVLFYTLAAHALYKNNALTETQTQSPLNITFTEGLLCPSLWWFLLPALIIAACAAHLYAAYDDILPYVTLWADFSGTAVCTASKSWRSLALPVAAQTLITLMCYGICLKIKSAPLSIKGVNARAELKHSRKRRTVWYVYTLIFASAADLILYAYIRLMFFAPQYKGFVSVIIYAALVVLLALALFLAYNTREK